MNAARTGLAVGAVVVGLALLFTAGKPAHPSVVGWAITGFLAVMFVLDMRESWIERREAIAADAASQAVIAPSSGRDGDPR